MGTTNWVMDKAEETAEEVQGSGKKFETVKNTIADKLHSAAQGLGGNIAEEEAKSGMGQYKKKASEWLDQSAEYVRQFEYKKTDNSIREYIRQKPGRSILIAGALGTIVGAIMRRR